jgi:CheY-like chemotaxis protein
MENILIIEDSKVQRSLIVSKIEKLGFKAIEAETGQEALEVLKDVKPHCIFCDIEMPTMNGIEFLNWAKDNNMSIPIFMLSLTINVDKKQECIDLGAKGFIPKMGITIERLEDAIHSIK